MLTAVSNISFAMALVIPVTTDSVPCLAEKWWSIMVPSVVLQQRMVPSCQEMCRRGDCGEHPGYLEK